MHQFADRDRGKECLGAAYVLLNGPSGKSVVNIVRSCLAKYLRRLRQDFTKSSPSLFLAEVHRKSCAK